MPPNIRLMGSQSFLTLLLVLDSLTENCNAQILPTWRYVRADELWVWVCVSVTNRYITGFFAIFISLHDYFQTV